MCRLFGIKTMIVPPVLLRDLVIPKSMQDGKSKAKFARDRHVMSKDTVWTMDALGPKRKVIELAGQAQVSTKQRDDAIRRILW